MSRISSWLTDPSSLRAKVARAAPIVLAATILTEMLNFARSVILARLLTPADFGLVGMALLWVSLSLVLTELGVGQALIHMQSDDPAAWSTAWWISAVRGVLLGGLLVLIAPWAEAFFAAPGLTAYLRVLAITVLLGNLQSMGIVQWQREMAFLQLKSVTLVAEIASLIAATYVAWQTRSPWALVVASVVRSLVLFIVPYVAHSFRPSRRFQPRIAGKILGYSTRMLGSGVLAYGILEGDGALVGKVLGATDLGLYRLAARLSNLPSTMVSQVLMQVMLPVYAQMQESLERQLNAYLKVLRAAAFLAFAMAVLLAMTAEEVIVLVYGSQWLAMVPAFIVMCWFGVARALGGLASPLFQAVGRPQVVVRLLFLQLVVMAVAVYPLTTSLGIAGTALAVTIAAVSNQLAVFYELSRHLHTSMLSLIKQICPFIGAATLAIVACLIFDRLVAPSSPWLALAVHGLTTGLVYVAVVAVILRRNLMDVVRVVMPRSRLRQNP